MMEAPSKRQRRTWRAWLVACGVALVLLSATRRTAPAGNHPRAKPHGASAERQPCPKCATAPFCELEGKVYECGSIFDWKFYTARHPKLANHTAAEATAHWLSTGFAQGLRSHPGRKTLKIVLMTKDEWPLLRSWVLYHADLVGAENLYIIDGSTDPRAIAFLGKVECQLGVHVFRSDADLTQLSELMTKLMRSLTMSADFLIKLDTDEFLAVSEPDASGARRTLIGSPVLDYLDSLTITDGRKLFTRRWQWGIPPVKCDTDPATSPDDAFKAPFLDEVRRKALFQAASFAFTDLGSHGGRVREGFNNTDAVETDLMLIEFRFDCYDRWTANNRKAVVSHGYLYNHDSDEGALGKLERLVSTSATTGPKKLPSIHKVQNYLNHLKDPEATRTAYYAQFDEDKRIKFKALRVLLQRLHNQFFQSEVLRCRRDPV